MKGYIENKFRDGEKNLFITILEVDASESVAIQSLKKVWSIVFHKICFFKA